jgi:hypothetical protein
MRQCDEVTVQTLSAAQHQSPLKHGVGGSSGLVHRSLFVTYLHGSWPLNAYSHHVPGIPIESAVT